MTDVPDIAHVPHVALATAQRHAMLPESAPSLVMVSGGADSVCLLRLFVQGAFGAHPLRVLHVNHLLRSQASDDDDAFVRALAEELATEARIVRYDVAAYADAESLNLEDAGRRIRYRFAEEELDAWCAELGVHSSLGRIAVAHTLDDRVETFFMRALWGAGTGGLASIAPVRGRIVRPLLDVSRAQVRGWLAKERGEGAWREDMTNDDVSRTRARVRATLVPVAEDLNPGFRRSLARSMDLLADDDALLTAMAAAFARDFAETRPGEEVAFNRPLMQTLDPTMARRTLRYALIDAFPEASRIESEHVEALLGGLGTAGFAHDLPFGLRAFSEYDTMVISRTDSRTSGVAPSLLIVPGTTSVGGAGTITVEIAEPAHTMGSARSIVIDAGSISGELTVDGPKPGDRMRPLGMTGTRKVSDLLVDAKIPKRARGGVPVVRDGERIVWLAGVRMSDDFRVTPETRRALRLVWRASAEGSA